MIVRVYDFLSAEKPKFSQNLVGIVSDVESFKYTRRAYDIGSFEMTIPTHADEAGCIQPDRMLIVGEKLGQTYIAGDPTKRIVKGTFLYVTDIEKKDDKITVTGYDLKYLFALRVTLFPKEEQDKGTYGYYVTSGTTFSCISDIINYNIVNATDSDRQIYGMFSITMPVNQTSADPPLTGIQDDRYMTRLEPVSTAIFNLLKNCKTHFYDMRLIIDDNAEDGDNYNPHMESSEDKPTIIIDESRYNIKSYTRKDGTSAYKNAIYAVVGSGDNVTVKCVKRPNDTASGVKRKEVVLDVDTDSVAEIDRYALKAAEENVVSDDFEIEPLFMDDEAEPELAQKVSIRIDGVEYETVITEITDEYANGKHTQSYVCGDKKLKVLNVLNKATAGNTQKIINNKITTGNAGGVGKFTNTDKTSEIFNDYNRNTAYGKYSHVEGYKNRMDSEGASRSWATHIEGEENTEASRTSCPSDKKASNNHIEGKLNSSYGRFNHIEGGGCIAEYDTQICHVEGSNSRVSEGARVAHVEGKDCVAGNECSHAEGKSAQATGYASHAEGGSCTASGNYSHAGGLSSEASGKCSYTGGELGTASGDYSHAEGLSNTASGNYSHALGKDNTASGDYSIVSGAGSKATGGYAIAHGYKCIANSGSMAIGSQSQASSDSYAFGTGLKAYLGTVAFGTYNKETNARFVIGGGTANNPFDVLWIDRECNLHVAGKVIADGGVGYVLPSATADTLGGVMIGDNISVTADGTISVDLSAYLKSADISEWAKAESKPAYTADEVGAAAQGHTHTKSQIADFPTLGTAAGKNAADFYPAKAASVLGGDYNALKTNGIFEMQGNADNPTANTPNGNHANNNFYVQVFYRNPKYLTQIATSVRADKTQYIRSLNNGVWNNWEKIKSGDADTLDGKHASDIAADITAAVNAVEIGGRNLLYYSRFDKKYPAGWAYSAVVSYTFDGNAATLTKAETTTRQFTTQASVSNGVVAANPNLLPENGCTYTISCEVMKAEGYDVGNGTKITTRYNFTDGTVKDFDVDVSGASETAWTKYSRTYTYASDKTVSYTQFIIALGAKACGIKIKNVKFEKGNKPTDWTPAPEDDERRIASLEARVAALEAAAVSGGEV